MINQGITTYKSFPEIELFRQTSITRIEGDRKPETLVKVDDDKDDYWPSLLSRLVILTC